MAKAKTQYATRRLIRDDNGILRVVYVDVKTGQQIPYSQIKNYNLTSGNGSRFGTNFLTGNRGGNRNHNGQGEDDMTRQDRRQMEKEEQMSKLFGTQFERTTEYGFNAEDSVKNASKNFPEAPFSDTTDQTNPDVPSMQQQNESFVKGTFEHPATGQNLQSTVNTGNVRNWTPEDRQAVAQTLAGELSPNTDLSTEEGRREAFGIITTIENRALAQGITVAEAAHQQNNGTFMYTAWAPQAINTTLNNYELNPAKFDTITSEYEQDPESRLGNFTNYYAHAVVTPDWASGLQDVEKIGNHTFGYDQMYDIPEVDLQKQAYGGLGLADMQEKYDSWANNVATDVINQNFVPNNLGTMWDGLGIANIPPDVASADAATGGYQNTSLDSYIGPNADENFTYDESSAETNRLASSNENAFGFAQNPNISASSVDPNAPTSAFNSYFMPSNTATIKSQDRLGVGGAETLSAPTTVDSSLQEGRSMAYQDRVYDNSVNPNAPTNSNNSYGWVDRMKYDNSVNPNAPTNANNYYNGPMGFGAYFNPNNMVWDSALDQGINSNGGSYGTEGRNFVNETPFNSAATVASRTGVFSSIPGGYMETGFARQATVAAIENESHDYGMHTGFMPGESSLDHNNGGSISGGTNNPEGITGNFGGMGGGGSGTTYGGFGTSMGGGSPSTPSTSTPSPSTPSPSNGTSPSPTSVNENSPTSANNGYNWSGY